LDYKIRYYRIIFPNKTSSLAGTNNKRTQLQNMTAYLFTPVHTPDVPNNAEWKLFLKQWVCWKKNISERNYKNSKSDVCTILCDPPKCTPDILINRCGKNPMVNGCFCKNRNGMW